MSVSLREHDRNLVTSGKGHEFRSQEAIVPDFDCVPERATVHLAGEQREEGVEIFGIELLGRRQLPVDRSQLIAEFRDAALDEAGDRRPGLRHLSAIAY
jgi:hypothetical protein